VKEAIMSTTEIVVFDGFDELDVVAPFEILVSAGYPVALVTMEPCQSVTGRHGMRLTPGGVLGPALIFSSFPAGGGPPRRPTACGAKSVEASFRRRSPTGTQGVAALPVSAPGEC
jgi:hypothetical protein